MGSNNNNNNNNFWQSFGSAAGGGIASSILGIGLAGLNDRRQVRQQDRLNENQFKWDSKLYELQQQGQYDMWKKTGPVGQMEQLELAGLNPGLIYGMSGAGGGTMGNGISSGGSGKAAAGGGEIVNLLNLQSQKAQIELMKAQAKKTNVEADNLDEDGIDTNLKKQNITESESRVMLNKVDFEIRKIDRNFKENSYEDNLSIIKSNAELLNNAAKVSNATLQTDIEIKQTHLIGLTIENNLKNSNIKVNEAEIYKMSEDIKQGWKRLSIEQQNMFINKINAETNKENANTRVRELVESTRNNDMIHGDKQDQIAIEKFVNDISKSDMLTIEMIKDIVSAGLIAKGMHKKEIKRNPIGFK